MTSSTDDPLVSTDWLAARLDDPKVKIIDASYKMPGVLPLPSDDYLGGHIPGAVFFDVNAIADHNDPRPHMYPGAEQFARDVAALGISTGDTVVAYDSGGWVAAPRAWWMFLSFGHRQCEGAGRRPEEMAARRTPDAFRQGDAEARKIRGQARSRLRPQQAAIAGQSAKPTPSNWSMRARVRVSRARSPSRGRAAAPVTSRAAATCPMPNCSTPGPAR